MSVKNKEYRIINKLYDFISCPFRARFVPVSCPLVPVNARKSIFFIEQMYLFLCKYKINY